MSKRLQDKVTVITGAGSGMGRAMAELFAEEGAKVICADISGKQEEVAKGIGANAVAVRADVASEDDIRAMIDIDTIFVVNINPQCRELSATKILNTPKHKPHTANNGFYQVC